MILTLAMVAACAHKNSPNEELEPPPDPIALHVKNENFLDMNVAVVANGVSRRLGTVSGNGAGTFSIAYNVASGQLITITATPIGGRGYASTGGLSLSPGQVIEFRVASQLRQSAVAVHDP
ncbi:MAG TPA: hypothetical protein VN706_20335 [Gemmatimonadaceae bacterium]|nr:hypothetical protein [Gemmatimonadaceae bacterium]